MPKHKYSLAVVMSLLVCMFSVRANAQISFAPAQIYPLTAVPFRVVAGDLNGDGKPDLAALSIYGGTVSTLLNQGDGTFAAPPRAFAALTPDPAGPTSFSGITVGDVNGDRKLDVILGHTTDVNSGDGIINVMLGNGDGTLQPPISTAVGSYAYKFVGVGDFNSDGRLDVACIADDPENTMTLVVLFLGNGDGTFVREASSQSAADYPGRVDVALADLNHDGKLDVVIPTKRNFVEVFLTKGDGTFRAPFQAPTPVPAFFVLAGDFNNDGRPDLISTSFQEYRCICPGFGIPNRWVPSGPPGGVSTLLAKGDGTFTASSFADDLGPSVAGDFDGDGDLDFVAQKYPDHGNPGPFDAYLGDGKGNFSSPTEIHQIIADPVSADVDGDGFSDLVWPTPNSSLQVALNNSSTIMLTASAPGPPIPAGGTASYTISVAQQHGQGATVTFSCSAPGGSHIGCSVSPQLVAAGATATLSVTTAGPSARLLRTGPSHQPPLHAVWLPLGAVFFAGVGLRGGPLRRKNLPSVVVGCLLFAGLIFEMACGQQKSPPIPSNLGTPSGTYAITVTGTAGTISRSTTVNLTVQ